jgi:hypothetical protein
MTLVTRMTRPMGILLGALLAGRVAHAQEVEAAMSADYGEPAGADQAGPPPPIPPYVEGPAVQARGGGYCFEGPHPVDSTVEPGVTWDNTAGRHVHRYPPFDLRLFNQQDGCYYFIGDPSDFGYAGETYSYYGAHPILASYGGGWCFMIGPHHHFWRPWSPMFATVGPWFYWEGPYDPFFWTYWPYYHYYYRAHYPVHYSHGAFFRSHVVAPRIPVVPRPPRLGTSWHAWYRGSATPGRPGAPGAIPARPGMAAPGAMPPRPRMAAPGAMPARPGMPAPGAMPARPMVPMQRGAAPSGSFAPHGYSAPAPRGGGFSAPAPRGGGYSAPTPHVGGGHFGGGFRGGRR